MTSAPDLERQNPVYPGVPPKRTDPRPPAQPDAQGRRGGWAAIWHFKWWVIGAALLAGLATWGISSFLPKTYEAEARVQVVVPSVETPTQDTILASTELARQYSELAAIPAVAQRAARDDGGSARDIQAATSAGTIGEQNVISITTQASTTEAAIRRANAVAIAFVDVVDERNAAVADEYAQQIRRRLRPIDRELAAARSDLSGIGTADAAITAAQINALQQVIQTLIVERQRLLAEAARASAAGRPSVTLVAPANSADLIQPRPVLYGLVAFGLVLLIGSQIASLAGRRLGDGQP